MRDRRVTVSELRAFNAALKKRLRKEQTRQHRINVWKTKNELILQELEALKGTTKLPAVRHVEAFGYVDEPPSPSEPGY